MHRKLATVLFSSLILATFVAQADDPPPATLSPPAGVVTPGTRAGIVTPDDGMEPNPLPLAPLPDQPVSPEPTPEPQSETTQKPQVMPPKPVVKPQNNSMMEKCKIVDRDGNGLIKAYAADSGANLEGDANAWIWVPRGQCRKLNQGDYSGVSAEIRSKINPSNIKNAQTLE